MEEPEVEGDELDAHLCRAGGRAVRLGAAVKNQIRRRRRPVARIRAFVPQSEQGDAAAAMWAGCPGQQTTGGASRRGIQGQRREVGVEFGRLDRVAGGLRGWWRMGITGDAVMGHMWAAADRNSLGGKKRTARGRQVEETGPWGIAGKK
jgi:hypothetical protein